MRVLITGSTGMVGNLILKQCIASSKIKEVVTLVRKASSSERNSKVNEVVVSDFTDYSAHASAFQGIGAAFFCIGVYTGQVKDDEFKRITVDYAVSFGEKLKEESPSATICLLSGQGADRTETSKTSFARYKGMAENRISQMGLEFYSFRPGYIYPVTPRKEPNLLYRLSRGLYPILKVFIKNSSIKSTELAQAMFYVGFNGSEKEILENTDIQTLV